MSEKRLEARLKTYANDKKTKSKKKYVFAFVEEECASVKDAFHRAHKAKRASEISRIFTMPSSKNPIGQLIATQLLIQHLHAYVEKSFQQLRYLLTEMSRMHEEIMSGEKKSKKRKRDDDTEKKQKLLLEAHDVTQKMLKHFSRQYQIVSTVTKNLDARVQQLYGDVEVHRQHLLGESIKAMKGDPNFNTEKPLITHPFQISNGGIPIIKKGKRVLHATSEKKI